MRLEENVPSSICPAFDWLYISGDLLRLRPRGLAVAEAGLGSTGTVAGNRSCQSRFYRGWSRRAPPEAPSCCAFEIEGALQSRRHKRKDGEETVIPGVLSAAGFIVP